MIDWLDVLLLSLASWRLGRMIVMESGPLGLFERVRTFIYTRNTPAWMQDGLSCVHCVSFWVSVFLGLFFLGLWTEYIFLVLASAGGASALELVLGDSEDG